MGCSNTEVFFYCYLSSLSLARQLPSFRILGDWRSAQDVGREAVWKRSVNNPLPSQWGWNAAEICMGSHPISSAISRHARPVCMMPEGGRVDWLRACSSGEAATDNVGWLGSLVCRPCRKGGRCPILCQQRSTPVAMMLLVRSERPTCDMRPGFWPFSCRALTSLFVGSV